MADLDAVLDAGFLLTETSTMPWHVLGILIVDPSTAPEPLPDLFPDVTDLAPRLPLALDEIVARAPEVAR